MGWNPRVPHQMLRHCCLAVSSFSCICNVCRNGRFHVVIRNHTVGIPRTSIGDAGLASEEPWSVGLLGPCRLVRSIRHDGCGSIVRVSDLTARVPGARVGAFIGKALLLLRPLESFERSGQVDRGSESSTWVGDVGRHCRRRWTVRCDLSSSVPCASIRNASIRTTEPSQMSG